jgi:hypothetical protein
MARQLELRFEVFKGTKISRPDPDPDPELRFEVFKGTNIFRSDPDPDPGISSEAGSIYRSIPTWILEPNHNPVLDNYNCLTH